MFDSYKARLLTHGRTYRDRSIYYAQQFAQKHAPDSIAYKPVLIDDRPTHVLIISDDLPTLKTIKAMPGDSFNVGQILVWQNSHWLITGKDNDDDVVTTGNIEQCNMLLKWQNVKTGEIVSRWCTADKPYYSNLNESNSISTSRREFRLQITYDSETSLIGLDKRFMIETIDDEPKTYRVVSVDVITERYDRDGEITGFLVWNIEQDQYNADTDSAEHGICNWVDPETLQPAKPDPVGGFISYRGSPTIRLGGSKKTFSYVDENKAAKLDITWEVVLPAGFESQFTYSANSDKLTISANDLAELEGTVITLKAVNAVTNAAATLEVEVIA